VSVAYLDSSFLLAILFGDERATTLSRILEGFDDLVSSDLLVAECLSATVREGADPDAVILALREVLARGHLRGADLWHVACALFVAPTDRSGLAFLSRDRAQRTVAGRLGFPTP